MYEDLKARVEVLESADMMAYQGLSFDFSTRISALEEQVARLTALVEGRNKSAATKRNMTDADALRTLTGDVKDMGHKETAELVNLTYAQVYSCRKEFTFKHVHKELRDQKWVNPWTK